MTQGFPSTPFLVNEDLTREDGVIRCRRVGADDLLRLGWRSLRALRILLELPIEL